MQNNEYCYKYDSMSKTIHRIKLQQDYMNSGFVPKPDDALYEDPSMITLGEHETLIILDEKWVKIPWYVGTKLYHKTNWAEMKITKVGKSPSDYPEYTGAEIPQPDYTKYYEYSESGWVFNLIKYKEDACKRVTTLCVNENYTMFPQHKRDNVYSGSPVTDYYPDYLKGDTGKQSIAKLNAVYQQIASNTQAAINSIDITTREDVDAIVDTILFPTEQEILAQIQS